MLSFKGWSRGIGVKMNPTAHSQDDTSPPRTAEFEALNELIEAGLVLVGPERAVAYLHVLASRLEGDDDNVLSLRDGMLGAKSRREARAWLRRRVTCWLAHHG